MGKEKLYFLNNHLAGSTSKKNFQAEKLISIFTFVGN